jgi:hypothetical protein
MNAQGSRPSGSQEVREQPATVAQQDDGTSSYLTGFKGMFKRVVRGAGAFVNNNAE